MPHQEKWTRVNGKMCLDTTFVLSSAQEALRQELIALVKVKYRDLPHYEGPAEGHLMGELVQPAHDLEGGTLHIPERRWRVYYQKNYGVVSQRLCTSNGSAWEIAGCVRDDTTFHPVSP